MKFGVIVFPGSNCDHDCYYVLKHIFHQDVEFIWHKETSIQHFDVIILPGGFSYGDYLRAGAIARFSPVMQAVIKFARQGGIVLGICNGFQILCESGLLPGVLMRNKNLRFICEYVHVRVENHETLFTSECKSHEILKIPIAHAEGLYYADQKTLDDLNKHGQVVFRYCDPQGNVTEQANPNGALQNIAGIINREGNVLGMMPHPERCAEKILNSEDGAKIFRSIIKTSLHKAQGGAYKEVVSI
ncbi:MAG: phosphoribosylformylglycinamidine synthase subunit PurQ [Calditrichaeota bacterium]|nr:MAG: phosphoribosylformylglycinamidine synthase subunit PurQ [Calditrichota bacterium]